MFVPLLVIALSLFTIFFIIPVMRMSWRASVTMFKEGSDEVYEYLCLHSVNGEVPEYAQVNAYHYMMAHGRPSDEALNFILMTCQTIRQEGAKAQRKIARARERINELSAIEVWLSTQSDVNSADAAFNVRQEIEQQEREIEHQKSNLHL